MKPTITLEMLDKAPGDSILAQGEAPDNSFGLNMMNTNRMMKWIAFRGMSNDWAIYANWADKGWSQVNQGEKVRSTSNIKNVLDISDDVLDKYRF